MKIKYFSWLPAVLLMIIIFSYSAKSAVNSNESSLNISEQVLSVFEKITDHTYVDIDREDIINIINTVVRKGAHFCEYALLSCLFALHLLVLKKKGKWMLIMPVILSALYAVTDELHQLFIPGRSCQLKDMLLDTCGAAAGSLLFMLFLILAAHHRKKKEKAAVMNL